MSSVSLEGRGQPCNFVKLVSIPMIIIRLHVIVVIVDVSVSK